MRVPPPGGGEAGLRPVTVHAPYLVNLASLAPELWERSVAALADQLVRGPRP